MIIIFDIIAMSLDDKFKKLKEQILSLPEEYDTDALQAVLYAYEEAKTAKNKEIRIMREKFEEEKKKAVYEAEKIVYAKYQDILSNRSNKPKVIKIKKDQSTQTDSITYLPLTSPINMSQEILYNINTQ